MSLRDVCCRSKSCHCEEYCDEAISRFPAFVEIPTVADSLGMTGIWLRFPRSLAPPPHFRSERLTARNDSYRVVMNENILPDTYDLLSIRNDKTMVFSLRFPPGFRAVLLHRPLWLPALRDSREYMQLQVSLHQFRTACYSNP